MLHLGGHKLTPTGDQASIGLAFFSFVTGDIDRAFALAGQALADGYPMTATMFVRPFERQLRGSPGGPDLLRRFNLPRRPRPEH